MHNTDSYLALLQVYPSEITKEQFYKICHISKRTAQYLLSNGIVPCKDTGKKTRRYTIKTKDVVQFLILRDEQPELYQIPFGACKAQCDSDYDNRLSHKLESLYRTIIAPYPDLLSTDEVCKITGYYKSTVIRWCSKLYLFHYQIQGKYLIPKESLIDFMLGKKYRNIRMKSEKHKQILNRLLK